NKLLIEIEKLKKDTKSKMKTIQTKDDENSKMKETIQRHLQIIQLKEKQVLEKEDEIKKMQKQYQQEKMKMNSCMEIIQTNFVEKEKQTLIRHEQFIKELKEKNTQLAQNYEKTIQQSNCKQKEEIQFANQHSYSVINFDLFRSAKLLKTCRGHTSVVSSMDYLSSDDGQFLCSGSLDQTVRVWDMNTSKQLKIFNGHFGYVWCVKFSPNHYYDNGRLTICSASSDKTIRFWDFETEKSIQILTGHADAINCIQFSPFNYGRYLCSGSADDTICLWDVRSCTLLHSFKGHTDNVLCVDFSSLQSSDASAGVETIGGNGYTICSGSSDNTVRLWDVETAKELTAFKGHEDIVWSVKYSQYGSGISGNIICSGSWDKTARLWDVRSKRQIQVFNRHKHAVTCIDCLSPINNSDNKIETGGSNIICSGSFDNTIQFWDIRTCKQLHTIKGRKHDRRVYSSSPFAFAFQTICSSYIFSNTRISKKFKVCFFPKSKQHRDCTQISSIYLVINELQKRKEQQ
ncbi:hypothetical protein RFI_04998, partial [Reticulomyxa filosa]